MNKKLVSCGLALTLCVTTFSKPVSAVSPVRCENIPSCGITGIIVATEIVGGILYYVVRTAAGAVHKVRSKQAPPAHRSNQGGDYIDKVIHIGIVRDEKTCEIIAQEYAKKHGGRWRAMTSRTGISTPEGSDNQIPSQPLLPRGDATRTGNSKVTHSKAPKF